MDSEDVNWYALWVKSRHEFVVAQELHHRGIDVFSPSATRIRQWKDRKKKVEFPLFPGYLFVHIAPSAQMFLDVVKTRGAVSFISLEPGHPTVVPPEEIASLKSLIDSGETIDVFPSLKSGMSVRIKWGPLQGVVGILVKGEDCHMFHVNINILGRSVGMKILAEDVEKA